MGMVIIIIIIAIIIIMEHIMFHIHLRMFVHLTQFRQLNSKYEEGKNNVPWTVFTAWYVCKTWSNATYTIHGFACMARRQHLWMV